MQTSYSDFRADGEEAFLPRSKTRANGIFLLEEYKLADWRFELGARQDWQTVSPRAARRAAACRAPRCRRQPSGTSRRVFGGIVAVALAAPADRAGALRQGVHLATNTYEIGNAGLGRETSHNIDLTLRKHSGATTFSASVFHNRVKNYIYANTLDRYEDFRLIEYTQRDAEFTGVEGELRHQFTPVFSAAVFGDYVRGKLTGGDGNLPRIPAARAGLRGNFKWQQWSAGVEYARVFSQKDIAAYENSTPGYNLVNAVVAYRGNYGSTGYEVYLRGTNLLNRLAYNHASFISSVAPLPGRSVLLGMRLTY